MKPFPFHRIRCFPVLVLAITLLVAPKATVAQATDAFSTEIHKAVKLGQRYFANPQRPTDPDAVLIYSYLKDRFNLPPLAQAEKTLEDIRADSTGQVHMFLRIVEPQACRMDFLDEDKGNELALAGVWYDELPDTNLLMQRIGQADWNDPYIATHALWAMAMARHCFGARPDTAVERRLVQRNMEVMEAKRPIWNDVAIEALAMVQYHDTSYVPPKEYIEEILSLQNRDGSWNWEPGDDKPGSQHTTILALWALLQYKPLDWPQQPRDMVVH